MPPLAEAQRPDDYAALWRAALDTGWHPDSLAAKLTRAIGAAQRTPGPGYVAKVLRTAADEGPPKSAQACPVPGCDLPGCTGPEPGESVDDPRATTPRLGDGESFGGLVAKVNRDAATEAAYRRAAVLADPDLTAQLAATGRDPDAWNGYLPPPYVPSRHGWMPNTSHERAELLAITDQLRRGRLPDRRDDTAESLEALRRHGDAMEAALKRAQG